MFAPAAAFAAEPTEIASAEEASEVGERPHVHITVDYAFEARRAAIKREYQGTISGSSFPNGVVPVVKDLRFKQTRHILTPRLAVGFYDIELHAALPIIISDSRTFSFDQTADPCVYPPDPEPTCVNQANSRTLQDGLLPGKDGGPKGFDANDPATGFAEASSTVFRGVNRSGLDQIHVGLSWAPFNQARDDTKPTWVIGVELRYSIGKIMKFRADDPGAEDGVSLGIHEFRAETAFSRKTTWAEPYVQFWWQAPFAVRGDTPEDPDGSLFWNTDKLDPSGQGFGQVPKLPMQQAGTVFGVEAYVWERPQQKQKLTVQLQGRVQAHFEGRGYSEMWEIFSYAGNRDTNPTGPLVLDRDPTTPGVQPLSHPGVTDIENYLSWAGSMGVRGQIGERARFSASFEIAGDQKHIISFTDAGVDSNDADDVITPNTHEVNPLHSSLIDTVGHRYIVDDSLIYTFMVDGTVMF